MIIDEINKDIATFMKESNKESLTTLKMAKNAIANEKINLKHDLSNEEAIDVIDKQIKMSKNFAKLHHKGTIFS